MIPELGHFALILAALVALILGTLPLLGAHHNRLAWIAVARPAASALALLVTFSFACLTQAFVANDFSVVYVAQHSNSLLPIQYRIAGVWGGHEGSLLLWMLMLTWWAFAVAMLSRQLPEAMVARVLGTLGLVAFGFLLFILITSSPFERLLPGADEGRDLNPLLQDPGLVIILTTGFSTVENAVAALKHGAFDEAEHVDELADRRAGVAVVEGGPHVLGWCGVGAVVAHVGMIIRVGPRRRERMGTAPVRSTR